MPRYSRSAAKDVEKAVHKMKRGALKSGRSGKKVRSRTQAIAIGLSEARKKGKKVPQKARSRSNRLNRMLETIAIIFLILWLLGMVSSYTMSGFIHVLLVIAIVMFLIRVIRGRTLVI